MLRPTWTSSGNCCLLKVLLYIHKLNYSSVIRFVCLVFTKTFARDPHL
jgi:hypothetical protein